MLKNKEKPQSDPKQMVKTSAGSFGTYIPVMIDREKRICLPIKK